MKILLNSKAKYCEKNDLFFINGLIQNQRKNNVMLLAYFGKNAISSIDVDYSINISLCLYKNGIEVYCIHVKDINTNIYCTRFELIKIC